MVFDFYFDGVTVKTGNKSEKLWKIKPKKQNNNAINIVLTHVYLISNTFIIFAVVTPVVMAMLDICSAAATQAWMAGS